MVSTDWNLSEPHRNLSWSGVVNIAGCYSNIPFSILYSQTSAKEMTGCESWFVYRISFSAQLYLSDKMWGEGSGGHGIEWECVTISACLTVNHNANLTNNDKQSVEVCLLPSPLSVIPRLDNSNHECNVLPCLYTAISFRADPGSNGFGAELLVLWFNAHGYFK